MKSFTGPDEQTTHIILVIDRSGSMASMAIEATNSIKTFIEDQRKVGPANFTLVQFDDQIEIVFDSVPISDSRLMEYKLTPRGMTQLYDAIGVAANAQKPAAGDKTICVILTDGHENSSREYTAKTIASLIKEKEAVGFEFLFLGANQDAVLSGGSFGMQSSRSINYSADAVHEGFAAIDQYITISRTSSVFEAESMLASIGNDASNMKKGI